MKRLAEYLFTLWLILTLNFALPRLLPGDPLAALFDPATSAFVFDDSARVRLMTYYGLDQPVLAQYGHYLTGLLRGDLGWSIYLNQPVAELVAARLPWTLGLVLAAMLLASGLSLAAGAEAAWRRNSTIDRLLTFVSVLVSNMPAFVTAMLLIVVFAARLRWFPMAGGRTPFANYADFWQAARDVLRHAALPLLTLASGMIAGNFLLIRNTMTGILGEDFILVARARGLGAPQIRYRHALRNALLPFVAQFAAHAALAITGSVFVEAAFDYPGMGRLIFEAVNHRDYPLIQGVFVVVSAAVLGANFLSDLASQALDPRLKEAASAQSRSNPEVESA